MKTDRAFTLLELLVVISIIAIIAALTVPVIRNMQEKAVQQTAAGNLKQIGAALFQYAADHEGLFPTAHGDIAYLPNPDPSTTISWQQQLDSYIGYSGDSPEPVSVRKIFTLRSVGPTYTRWGKNAFFLGAYAAQQEGAEAMNLNRIERPSMHILAGEQVVAGPYTSVDADKDDYGSNNPAFGSSRNPNRVAQILFADGHVAGFKEFDSRYMTVRYEGVKADGLGYPYGE